MLTKEDLLSTVADRINHILGGCNSHYTQYQSAIVRGLLWAYLGKDPGPLGTTEQVEELIGEQFHLQDGKFSYTPVPEAL